MKITVDVTQNDINGARKRCSFSSPIALALTRKVPVMGQIHVFDGRIFLGYATIDLPQNALAFMAVFDQWNETYMVGPECVAAKKVMKLIHDKPVKLVPFSFEIDVPLNYMAFAINAPVIKKP